MIWLVVGAIAFILLLFKLGYRPSAYQKLRAIDPNKMPACPDCGQRQNYAYLKNCALSRGYFEHHCEVCGYIWKED